MLPKGEAELQWVHDNWTVGRTPETPGKQLTCFGQTPLCTGATQQRAFSRALLADPRSLPPLTDVEGLPGDQTKLPSPFHFFLLLLSHAGSLCLKFFTHKAFSHRLSIWHSHVTIKHQWMGDGYILV